MPILFNRAISTFAETPSIDEHGALKRKGFQGRADSTKKALGSLP